MMHGAAARLRELSQKERSPAEDVEYKFLVARSNKANADMAASFAKQLNAPSKTSVEPSRPVMRNAIPLDSIVATVPPTYRLNYLMTECGRLTPLVHPIAMMPHGYGAVKFKFWGFDSFDVHTAFPKFKSEAQQDRLIVTGVNYQIIVHAGEGEDNPGVSAHYNHDFQVGSKPVYLGLEGLCSIRPIFKFYKALEHLPKLPNGWQYLQFIA